MMRLLVPTAVLCPAGAPLLIDGDTLTASVTSGRAPVEFFADARTGSTETRCFGTSSR
jgi:hypothetical protein